MKNHIPTYDQFVNEKRNELNETGFKTSDMQKTIDYIKKEVGENPGYAFFGDDEDIEDFNKSWNAKKYKDAFDIMAVASNMELYDFNTVKKILSESKVNEGAVKKFEMDYNTMVKNIKSGYGWIDPEYVADTWENSSDSIDFALVKDELYNRLIKAGLLYFADDNDEEEKGKKVTNISQIK
jgi:hypothetical protein